jgi:hypothetical protein
MPPEAERIPNSPRNAHGRSTSCRDASAGHKGSAPDSSDRQHFFAMRHNRDRRNYRDHRNIKGIPEK